MKKIKLLTYFLFSIMFLFCLAACDESTISAPTITSNGLTVSWNEVEGADKYLIYDTIDDTMIAETTDLIYTFSNMIEDKSIYVKSLNEEEGKTIYSEKSNIVTVFVPTLEAPFLTSSENSVFWSAIKDAAYYKVYNAEDDSEIIETDGLSCIFDKDYVHDLKVYVIAYYEDNLLDSKKSNKSNIVTINPTVTIDHTTIDVSKTSSSSFEITENIMSICFTGEANSSWSITVKERSSKLDITFDNLSIYSYGNVLTAYNNNYELNLHVKGNCSVRSSNAAPIVVSKLNIDGTFHSSLVVSAGKGKDGSDGTQGSQGSYGGGSAENGSNGSNGERGYDAIQASILNLSDIHLTCTGGNGGNGGDGGKGGTGGTGKTLVHILNGGKDGNKNFGGKGGNGGNGGNGGAPGYGISQVCVIHNDGTAIVVTANGSYGAGGNGGNGGIGGEGGNYYNSLGSVWQCAGGSGGNGGNGGKGSKPGSKGKGGSIGSRGTGKSVNGIGLGINYGKVFYDGGNNPTAGTDGTDGGSL